MYQYGNVAVQYQNKKRRVRQTQLGHRPQFQPEPKKETVYYGLSTGEKILYICAIFVFVSGLSILLASNATISQLNYEIQFLEKETANIEEMNSNLLLEVATLSSPDRIISIATSQLGLGQKDSTVRILSNNNKQEGNSNQE